MCQKGRLLTRQWIYQSLSLTFLLVFSQSVRGENRFILRAPAASVPGIASRHSLRVGSNPDDQGVSLVTTSDTRTPAEVVTELRTDPNVVGIELDGAIEIPETAAALQPSLSAASIAFALAGRNPVPYFGSHPWNSYVNQSATSLVRLDNMQDVSVTGTGIVAVIDTGVDPSQPILQDSLVPGYDFVHDTPGIASEWTDVDAATAALLIHAAAPIAPIKMSQSTAAILDQSTAAILDTSHIPKAFGHGTMVAGIIHLVAPTARIMPIKAFSADGTANLVDIVRAIYFAVDNGARVINMSFSMPGLSLELMKAVDYASTHNVICVASVGNGGSETIVFPASFHNVLGVASTDALDHKSNFSNFGAALADMAAPGEGVITTYPGGNYAVASGTSFSAPLVSGAVALIQQIDPNADYNDIVRSVLHSKKLTSDLGYGRLDLKEILEHLMTP